MTTKIRTYSELSVYESYDDRFEYLKLGGEVGVATFGFDRYVNQAFYTSREWRSVRQHVLIRDDGCDLGVFGFEIHTSVLIHHMNPVSVHDILAREDWIFDPEFLITTTKKTHNAIHYGNPSPYPKVVARREPGDTRLW